MNKILYILVFISIALLISTLFFPQDKKVINHQVLMRQNIAYDRNSTTPFTGTVEIYYDDGQLKESSNYKNGKREGISKEFIGPSRKYYAESFYKDGKRHGLYQSFENGNLLEIINYKDDKRHGLHQFFENGILRSEKFYKNDKIDGVYKYFFENGSLKQYGTYKNGKEHGPFELYNLKGEVINKGYMKNGVRVEEKKP